MTIVGNKVVELREDSIYNDFRYRRMRYAGDFLNEKPKKQIYGLPGHKRIFQAKVPHKDASSKSQYGTEGAIRK